MAKKYSDVELLLLVLTNAAVLKFLNDNPTSEEVEKFTLDWMERNKAALNVVLKEEYGR